MSCRNLINNNKCGKCKYNLLSTDFIKSVDILKLFRTAANLVWMDYFRQSDTESYTFDCVNITCTNNIEIVVYKGCDDNLTIAKHIYHKLVNNWYNYHGLYKKLESYAYIKDRLKLITTCLSIKKLRSDSIFITKYIKEMYICNGTCTTVTPSKEVGRCKMSLSDIQTVTKFTSQGLVDTFNTILYTLKDLSIANLTMNLDSTYVTCSGNIIMEENFTECKSTLISIKTAYIYYLSVWCTINVSKESEVYKIKESINMVNNANSVGKMYEYSCHLLETL